MTELFQTTAQQEYQRATTQFKNSKDANAALKKSYARYDNLIAVAVDESPTKPECKAGCAFCCHYKVEARAHEVLLAKDYIRTHFSAGQKAQLVERLTANAAIIRTLTPEQHLLTNIRCALLDNNQCSIYPARPFRCRNFHSTDAQACEASFNHPDDMAIATGMIEGVAILADAHTQGFEAAAAQTGRDNRIYDFTTALLEALADDQPLKRYQRGKKAFQQGIEVVAE
ncbi:YkgJ family cysteine cluster protein [Cellvibrio sp. pealriver]|uniref:YkgJ family cysteine cluster protein n=1 Tax=Cellvibrio sp. pealriver TaxID=1622269 RepID=UPI00066FE65D|nr:YkgJ family cysteine cluster protein [Cellvibrio sp. pealriver]